MRDTPCYGSGFTGWGAAATSRIPRVRWRNFARKLEVCNGFLFATHAHKSLPRNPYFILCPGWRFPFGFGLGYGFPWQSRLIQVFRKHSAFFLPPVAHVWVSSWGFRIPDSLRGLRTLNIICCPHDNRRSVLTSGQDNVFLVLEWVIRILIILKLLHIIWFDLRNASSAFWGIEWKWESVKLVNGIWKMVTIAMAGNPPASRPHPNMGYRDFPHPRGLHGISILALKSAKVNYNQRLPSRQDKASLARKGLKSIRTHTCEFNLCKSVSRLWLIASQEEVEPGGCRRHFQSPKRRGTSIHIYGEHTSTSRPPSPGSSLITVHKYATECVSFRTSQTGLKG